MSYAIEAEGLTKRSGATLALEGVDLAARTGSALGVLGPNGTGKTTAVRILATLLQADGGSARVAGYELRTQAHQVRGAIALTVSPPRWTSRSPARRTTFSPRPAVGTVPGRRPTASPANLLGQFGLADASSRAARTHSGGMRRCLDLAASLVRRPRLLFLRQLDEQVAHARARDVEAGAPVLYEQRTQDCDAHPSIVACLATVPAGDAAVGHSSALLDVRPAGRPASAPAS